MSPNLFLLRFRRNLDGFCCGTYPSPSWFLLQWSCKSDVFANFLSQTEHDSFRLSLWNWIQWRYSGEKFRILKQSEADRPWLAGPVIESLPMRSNMIDTNRFSLKRLVTYFARKWSFVSMSSYMSSHMIEIKWFVFTDGIERTFDRTIRIFSF